MIRRELTALTHRPGFVKTFSALAVRNYRLFAAGALVSNIGTWMQRVAQDWLVLKVSDDNATALGITTGLQFLPVLLISPFAGVLADRLPKRILLMATQAAAMITACMLGVLAVTGTVQLWHIYVLTFLFGTAAAIDTPARHAFVNEMIGPERLVNAVSLNSASFNLARMIGPAVAGVLIAVLGDGVSATGWVILLNGASFIAVLISLKQMRTEELHPTPPLKRGPGQLRDAARYILTRADIMVVMGVVSFAGTFGLNFQMTTALMATDVYDKGAGEYGVLGSILAIGSLTGALLGARRTSTRQRLVIVSGLTFGAAVMVAGLMPTYATFALFLPVAGVLAMTMITAANSFVQLAVRDDMRGRVMAIYMAVFMGGTPIGAPLLGAVSDSLGARWTLIGGGLITIAGILLVVVWGARRQSLVLTSYIHSRRHPEPVPVPISD